MSGTNTDTPETDKFTAFMNGADDATHLIALDLFARKLERERDEAREELTEVKKDYLSLSTRLDGHDATECLANLTRIIEQRDILVEEIKIALGCLVTNYDIDGISMSDSDAADHLRKALAAVKGVAE